MVNIVIITPTSASPGEVAYRIDQSKSRGSVTQTLKLAALAGTRLQELLGLYAWIYVASGQRCDARGLALVLG